MILVDDDPWQLEILEYFFEPEKNINLTVFSSVAEALGSIILDEYDCVVTDYHMEGIDGLEFLKIIRNISNMPVILFTMVDDDALIGQATEAGVNRILIKGSDFASIKTLTDEIKKQVKNSRMHQQTRSRR